MKEVLVEESGTALQLVFSHPSCDPQPSRIGPADRPVREDRRRPGLTIERLSLREAPVYHNLAIFRCVCPAVAGPTVFGRTTASETPRVRVRDGERASEPLLRRRIDVHEGPKPGVEFADRLFVNLSDPDLAVEGDDLQDPLFD